MTRNVLVSGKFEAHTVQSLQASLACKSLGVIQTVCDWCRDIVRDESIEGLDLSSGCRLSPHFRGPLPRSLCVNVRFRGKCTEDLAACLR